MKAVQLTKDIPGQGLVKGDVLEVDELSAANMIKGGKAKAFEPESAASAEELKEVEYGGQKVRTIDDIVDPTAKRMKGVMHVQRLVGADPGPGRRSVAEAESTGDAAADSTPGEATNEATDAALAAGQEPPTTDTGEQSAAPKRGSKSARVATGANPSGGDAAHGGDS